MEMRSAKVYDQTMWKTLCPYVLSTCDASNERVAWSAIDTERKGVKEKRSKVTCPALSI